MPEFSINNLSDWLSNRQPSQIIILTDENTAKYCLPVVENTFKSGFLHINIPSGEHFKTLESASLIWDGLLENNIDRNALLINLGGGMISDLGGFCAATYKRGISFINVPTTLLAMVDAAIGGKTGINIRGYKNQVGVFAEAEEVFIDPMFLKTLPNRELVSGFAEVIKYGLIYDARMFDELLKTGPLEIEDWLPVIKQCVRIKSEIVSQDPTEQGIRKILNFGHTIGHAIESYSLEHDDKPLLHGEAVALGMIAESYLSFKKTRLKKSDLEGTSKNLPLNPSPLGEGWGEAIKRGVFGSPLEVITNYLIRNFGSCILGITDPNNLHKYMLNDKKNVGNSVRFVLLEGIGNAVYESVCSFEEIDEAFDYLQTYGIIKKIRVKAHEINHIRITYTPQKLNGSVHLPASKSISNRALVIRALSESPFAIENLSDAGDTVLLESLFKANEKEIYVRNAGTVARFLLAYYASRSSDVILTGSERMNERPIVDLVSSLQQIGADIEFMLNKDRLPVHIHGHTLNGGSATLSATASSQFVSALLMIAPTLREGLSLELTGEVVSEPYIMLTLNMMSFFGIEYLKGTSKNLPLTPSPLGEGRGEAIKKGVFESPLKQYNHITIPPQKYISKPFFVESDWSSASYFYALAALFPGSELQFENLFEGSHQGDSILIELMKPFGVETIFGGGKCSIKSATSHIKSFRYDFINFPDLIPTFVCLCCALNIPFSISGTKTLKYKESNRAEVLQTELAKLGYALQNEDNMIIHTGLHQPINAGDIILETHNDHRMAMSFAILAARNPNIRITNPDVVEKSFPGFWQEIKNLSFQLNS